MLNLDGLLLMFVLPNLMEAFMTTHCRNQPIKKLGLVIDLGYLCWLSCLRCIL